MHYFSFAAVGGAGQPSGGKNSRAVGASNGHSGPTGVQALGEGQERLAVGLHHVSEAQTQTSMLKLMEQRLALVQ